MDVIQGEDDDVLIHSAAKARTEFKVVVEAVRQPTNIIIKYGHGRHLSCADDYGVDP